MSDICFMGPYAVLLVRAPTPLLDGKWCVQSDISNRVPIFDTKAEAVKRMESNYRAWKRRHPEAR